MAFDIYVGSLTRYCTGDWENSAQKAFGSMGIPYKKITLGAPSPEALNAEEHRESILAWQANIGEQLKDDLTSPFAWDEGPHTPHFTEQPGWDGYASLLLAAAHEEHPGLPAPEAGATEWSEDPPYKACTTEGFESRYPNLLGSPLGSVELWVPCAFEFPFYTPTPFGEDTGIGSSVQLLRELRTLNDRTWKQDAAGLERWRKEGVGDLRLAFLTFLDLAGKSVEHRLPMKLDY